MTTRIAHSCHSIWTTRDGEQLSTPRTDVPASPFDHLLPGHAAFRHAVLHQLYCIDATWLIRLCFFDIRRLSEATRRFTPRKHQILFRENTMKRLIATTLTVALFTGLYAGKASAQDALGATAEGKGLLDLNGLNAGPVDGLNACDDGFVYGAMCTNELIAIIAFAATEFGIIDPDDCPNVMDRVYNGLADFTAWFQPMSIRKKTRTRTGLTATVSWPTNHGIS